MADIVKVNYGELEAMKNHCAATAKRLQETVRLAQTIATQMENGALIGDSGAAFSEALKGPFVVSVNRLSEKFEEVARDIEKAIADMKEKDSQAAGNFTN